MSAESTADGGTTAPARDTAEPAGSTPSGWVARRARDRGPVVITTLALLAYAAWQARAAGVEWWRFCAVVAVMTALGWAVGSSVVAAMGSNAVDRRLDGPFPRVLLGLGLLAGLNLLLAEVLPDDLVPLVLVVLTTLVFVATAWRVGVRTTLLPAGGTAGWAALAALLAVGATSSRYLVSGPDKVTVTQYWDLLVHLAVAKVGLLRGGLPLTANPFVADAPAPSYHLGFDALSATLLRAAGGNPDAAFYGIVLPLLAAMLFGSLCVAASAISRDHLGGVTMAALLGVSLLLARVPSVGALLGDAGSSASTQLGYFFYNPPAAIGIVTASLALAQLASVGRVGSPVPALAVGAVLAGMSVAMKANLGIVVVPAYLGAIAWVWHRRWISLPMAGAISTCLAVTASLAYLTTRGAGPGIGVSWGEYAHYLLTTAQAHGAPRVLAALAGALSPLGGLGDVLFLFGYVLVVLLGWRLLLLLLLLPALRGRGTAHRQEPGLRASLIFSALAAGGAVVVGLTLVQPDTGRFEAWNIAAHTVMILYVLGLVWASVGLARAVRTRPRVAGHRWARATAALVVAVAVVAGATGIGAVRRVGHEAIDANVYALLTRLAAHVPAGAVVLQEVDVERNSWVAGIGGRQPLLERAETWREYAPVEAARNERLLTTAYAASDPAELERGGVLGHGWFAIVGPAEGLALRAVGVERDRSGPWVLVELP